MENNAIFIIKTFSKDEIKQFRNFLSSPFFNESKKLIKFYDALIKFYPVFNSKFLSEIRLMKIVSPELEFNKLTVNRLFFDLYNCAEKFLLMKNLESNPFKSQDLLRNEFFKRRLFKLIDKNLRNVKDEIETCKNIDSTYYLNMFYLYTDIYNLELITSTKSSYGRIRNRFEALTERGKYISCFFATEMVREYENLLTYFRTYKSENRLNLIPEMFSAFDFPELIKLLISRSCNADQSNNLSLYLALLNTFSNPDDEKYYTEYKRKLISGFKDLSTDEKRFHFGRLIRYCLTKIEENEQYSKFNQELFKVHEFILKSENYRSTVTHYIPMELFRGVLKHSLKLKKYKWSIEFIKKYSRLLNPERRKNLYYYSIAEYYFYRKMYRDAIHNLHKVDQNEFIFKLDFKNIMLISYFELKEYESALDLIDSYKHFLANDTLSMQSRKRHRNFISIVKNIILCKTSVNKISTYHIEKGFDNNLPYSEWVREKILELDIKFRRAI